MNQKGISTIVIILLIVGVLAAAGGIYYFAVQKPRYIEQPQPVLPPQPEKEPVTSTPPEAQQPSPTDETANWKTYTDKDYKFAIKYPENFTVRKIYFPEENELIVRFLTPEQAQIPKESPFQSNFLSIRATKVDPKIDLENYIKTRYRRTFSKTEMDLFSKIETEGKFEASREEAQEKFDDLSYFDKITIGEGISGYILSFWGKGEVSDIYIKHEDILIEIDKRELGYDHTFFLEHPVAVKILKSFKFLEED